NLAILEEKPIRLIWQHLWRFSDNAEPFRIESQLSVSGMTCTNAKPRVPMQRVALCPFLQ
ncbi:MAG: hypothetical protein ACK43N_16380, partial [Pirellulaceae bacterium]